MKSTARRTTFELKAPASPRSAVMMTICRRGPSRCSSIGWGAPSAAALTRLPRSSAILLAYGRAARIRSCARRSFAAATSFIARVIFCVDWTERIRRWMSRSVAMRPDLRGLDALRRGELRLGLGHRRRQRIACRVRELLAVADLGEDLRRAALEPGVEEGLELADRVDRQIVEESLRP